MAKNKKKVLLILILFLVANGITLDFKVKVTPKPELSIYQPSTFTSNYFNASVSVQNPGSVGCEVRIKGEIDQGDQQITRYSRAYKMWPGENTEAEFFYLPINYSGNVQTNLSAVYCDQEESIGSYSFNMTEKVVPNRTIDSKTLEVNSSSAFVEFEVEKALLIPQKYPAYWKVGSVKVNKNKALIKYDPTLFKNGESITYTVIENKTVIGKTEVVLEDQEKWYEEIIRQISSFF